jgi:RHS repeat-associated protein
MTVAGQPMVNYTYDNADRLAQIAQGTSTVASGYDAANRRTSLTLPNGVAMSYSYDSASQLTGLTCSLGSSSLGNLAYSYDLAGRRAQVGGSFARTGLPLAVTTTAYNANNEFTQWGTAALTYDANGNMTSDGVNSFVWNARNQLASMNLGASSFQYDPFGRRVGKTVSGATTNYLYDGGNVAQELSGTAPTANLLTGGVDEIFSRTDASGARNFLADALGSTLALTDSTGGTLTQYTYEPFGNTTVSGSASANPYQYTGRENDRTGLYFYRARHYNPVLQRFVSEDPIGFFGGDVNFYPYVRNNPLRYRDPQGKDPIIGAAVGAVAGGIYGALGAALQGGSAGDVLIGAGVGAGIGFGTGFVDPSFGVGTLAITTAVAGGAGDIVGQWIGGAGGPCKPFNWGSTIGAVAGGALAGAGGAGLGINAAKLGLPELPVTVGAAALTSGPAILLNATGAALWPSMNSPKCGCQR